MNEVHFTKIQTKIAETLKEAKEEIVIAVAWFTDQYLLRVLEQMVKSNIKVTILIYDDKINNKNLFENLFSSEANIFLSKKMMHNKFCVIDKKIVINGSYNWTYNASTNKENIQITKDYFVANQFLKEFDKLLINAYSIKDYFTSEDEKFEVFHSNFKKDYNYPYFVNYNSKSINTNEQKNTAILITNDEELRMFHYYLYKEQHEFYPKTLRKLKENLYQLVQAFNPEIDNVLYCKQTETQIRYLYVFYSWNEIEIFNQHSAIHISGNLFRRINRLTQLDVLYDTLLTWKQKLPDDVIDLNSLKKYVLDLISKRYQLKDKLHLPLAEEIILYKLYYGYLNNSTRDEFGYLKIADLNLIYLEQNQMWKVVNSNLEDIIGFQNIKFSPNLVSLINFRSYFVVETKSGDFIYNKSSGEYFSNNESLYTHNYIHLRKQINRPKFESGRYLWGIQDLDKNELLTPCFEFLLEQGVSTVEYASRADFHTQMFQGELAIMPIYYAQHDYISEKKRFQNTLKHFSFNIEQKRIFSEKLKFANTQYLYIAEQEYKYLSLYSYLYRQNKPIKISTVDLIKKKLDDENLAGLSSEVAFTKFPQILEELEKSLSKIHQGKNCYIATAVYNDNDHPNVQYLRTLRDNILSNYILGKYFIKLYYTFSPKIAAKLSKFKFFSIIVKMMLDAIIKVIKI